MSPELIEWLVLHAKGTEWNYECDWDYCRYCRRDGDKDNHKEGCEYVTMMERIRKEMP